MSRIPDSLEAWLAAKALELDTDTSDAASILPALAEAGLFGVGIGNAAGGSGGDIADAVEAIAAVSARSLAAGFVFWGQRTFIEYLLQSPNERLREKLLPDLIAGRRAGATGLSNAMKFLAGIEELQIKARRDAGNSQQLILDGKLPWVTNLRSQGFDVAAAVEGAGHGPAFVAVLSSEDDGLLRSPDLELMAMRATNTAAISLSGVRIGAERILHVNASEWLPRVRPAFLGLQCGMSIGLARCALEQAGRRLGSGRAVLGEPLENLTTELSGQTSLLVAGLRTSRFVEWPAELFEIRIELANIATGALQLELQACGGAAYLSKPGQETQRRLREGAFIPLITPSLVQLKSALRAHTTARRVGEVA